jgi:hypothetical protein
VRELESAPLFGNKYIEADQTSWSHKTAILLYELTARALRTAFDRSVIAETDLWGGDKQLWEKMSQSQDPAGRNASAIRIGRRVPGLSRKLSENAGIHNFTSLSRLSWRSASVHEDGDQARSSHSGGGSSSSGSHSSGHSTVSSSSRCTTAVSEGRTHATSSKNRKRWLFFGRVMHTACPSQPASMTPGHTTECEPYKKVP